MFEGLYTRSAPPTTTRWFVDPALVGSAEPGYEPYVVVQTLLPSVTVSDTVTTDGVVVGASTVDVVLVPLAFAAAWNSANLPWSLTLVEYHSVSKTQFR